FQNPLIYLGAVRKFYEHPTRAYAVQRAIAGDFDDIALVTAGYNQGYISEYVTRTTALVAALQSAQLADMPEIDYQVFALSRAQVIALQKALAALNAGYAQRIAASGGFDGVAGNTTLAILCESGKTVGELLT
ncbi:MAG: hypothetical protein ACRCSS_20115, partial [Shewanella sp.]